MSMAPMEGIKPLWDAMPILAQQEENAPAGSTPLFADIFHSAIENVKQTDAVRSDLQYKLAVGELDNPAELSIASSKASMSVELLIQLRNKALDAYSEMMRISL